MPFVMFFTRLKQRGHADAAPSDPLICASASSFRRASSGLDLFDASVHHRADVADVEAALLEQVRHAIGA